MKCQRARSDGNPCGNYAVRGTNLCRKHGGMSKQVRRKAIVRAELSAWGLTDEHVDPGETLLRLVAQSARRAALYSDLLRRAYEDDPSFPDAFAGANVAALIGHKYALTKEGDRVAVEEAVRGLVELEAAERDRCARFCKLAIDAGLEERRVRLAEEQGAVIVSVIEAVLAGLGLSVEQRSRVPVVVPAALRALDGVVA
jgi:hypothetical protein